MCDGWKMTDKVGQDIFKELAAEGRDIYQKRLAEYHNHHPKYLHPSYMKLPYHYKADRKNKSAEAAKKKSSITFPGPPKPSYLPARLTPPTGMDMHPLLPLLFRDAYKTEESSYGHSTIPLSEDSCTSKPLTPQDHFRICFLSDEDEHLLNREASRQSISTNYVSTNFHKDYKMLPLPPRHWWRPSAWCGRSATITTDERWRYELLLTT